jgi:transcription initiation factor TFIIB
MNLNLRLVCRDCQDSVPNIVEDFTAGDLICGTCGLVLGNRVIDTRSGTGFANP